MENNYRFLETGDIIFSGDEYLISEYYNHWAPVPRYSIRNLMRHNTTFYRRPIKEN